MASCQLGILWDDTQCLLPCKGFFAHFVPTNGKLTLVLTSPFLGHMVRGVRRTRRKVYEEGFVGHQRLLLANPVDGMICQVFSQVVSLLRHHQRVRPEFGPHTTRIPLVTLAANEAVEVLEAAAARRPVLKRPHRTAFPNRHFVALAEHGCGVAVQLQGQGHRRFCVGP